VSVNHKIDVDVVRAVETAPELRSSDADGLGVLAGHFSGFDTWYRVDSLREGEFMERTAPGFVRDTIASDRPRMRVLFDHGFDAQIGNKVLGMITDLREDGTGAYCEVDLLDTSYNRDRVPGLRAGVYGASFRMRVQDDDWVEKPDRSEHNPGRLPERTITRAKVLEFGPVTFPANPEATAGVRSMTDEFYTRRRSRNPIFAGLSIEPMSDAERSRRYRQRKKLGDAVVPRVPPGQKPLSWYAENHPTPPMSWDRALEVLGLDGDQQRAWDRIDAVQSRAKADRNANRDRIEQLAVGVKKARRVEQLAREDWRRKPTSASTDELSAAVRARDLLEQELRAACAGDLGIVAEALDWAYGQ
jgi:HK97 family phage prohead protease